MLSWSCFCAWFAAVDAARKAADDPTRKTADGFSMRLKVLANLYQQWFRGTSKVCARKDVQ